MRRDVGEVVKLAVGTVGALCVARWVWSRLRKELLAGGKDEATNGVAKSNGQATPPAPCNSSSDGIWIYFGSQTGTAEGFSRELEQEAARYGLQASVVDMEDFNPDEFVQHKVALVVIATYGEGDPTDNAIDFFKWLQDASHSAEMLTGMSYAVMGLGNRQYVNFNACGKIVDEQLEKLGAVRVHSLGVGDDDQNIEEDFEQWKETGLWPALQAALGQEVSNGAALTSGDALETADVVSSKLPLQVELREEVGALPVDPLVQVGGADVLGKWYFHSYQAPITRCDEIRQVSDPSRGKTTKHIDVAVKHLPALNWHTADNLEVLPKNPEATVAWFAKRLGVDDALDHGVTFVRANGVDKAVKKPFPTPCTVRTALELYCDLLATPAHFAAKRLAAFAQDEQERALVERLLQDHETYHWLTGEKVRLTLREFFELFLPSATLDIGAFLQLCPRQKSRPYTIASSSREDPHHIGICVSMVQEELPKLSEVLAGLKERGYEAPGAAAYISLLGGGADYLRSFQGACSTMLCTRASKGDELWILSRPSTFRLPKKASAPIIMVGAGTGVAPFRAFVREFRAEGCSRKKTLLFFGCQKKDHDFLYREELQEASTQEPPALQELVMAFSRDQEQKVYVQHLLHQRASDIAELIGNGAYVYVCGGTSMGRSVRDELVLALGSADYVSRLQTEGRLVEELW